MKILVIEDDHHIANNLKKGLEMKAHVVDVANDGDDGYDFAVGEDYDVIVLDRMLPRKDGLQICQQLRSEGSVTPILMLTAKTMVGDRVDGLNAGADDYLGKPFAFEELLARVNALSRRPTNEVTPIIQVGDLQLNPIQAKVRRDEKVVELSKKEFALLDFMMRHPGTLFTKEQLIEHVWAFEADVLPNTAQVYIGYLRNKIDKPFPNDPVHIHTVRGFGYKLE